MLPNFATKEQCQQLKDRASELVEAFDPVDVAVFSTTNQVTNCTHRGHRAQQCCGTFSCRS